MSEITIEKIKRRLELGDKLTLTKEENLEYSSLNKQITPHKGIWGEAKFLLSSLTAANETIRRQGLAIAKLKQQRRSSLDDRYSVDTTEEVRALIATLDTEIDAILSSEGKGG